MTIIVFPAFGYSEGYFRPNGLLSEEAAAQAREFGGCPVFSDPQTKMGANRTDVRVMDGPKRTTATLELFAWAARQLSRLDDVRVVIVAAPQHQLRSVWCAKQAGFKNIFLPKFQVAPEDEISYWGPGNLHWQTRGPLLWRLHETLNWALIYLAPRLYSRLARGKTR